MKTPHKAAGQGVQLVTIGPEAAGQRLDNFLLRQLKGVPKSHVYRLLRKGEVRVNKGRAKPDRRLEEGDTVRLPPVARAEPTATPEVSPGLGAALAAAILFEDEDLLVLNKPAGLPVHAGSGVSLGVIEAMRSLRPNQPFLELAHRLDRDTSGCLILAKSRRALTDLHELLRDGGVDKRYLALVAGRWQGGARRVTEGLSRGGRQGEVRLVQVDEDGKAAESLFEPERRFATATLMAVKIGTGRTHQIRVHAAHVGHPVAGDRRYGDFEFNREMKALGLKRLFLHAESLAFRLPTSGKVYRVKAPLDDELKAVLECL
ncbi:MAG: 23S rRNA pseudouridine(955/2504/2580) synthase RluC [Ectothiorhodospiraceae bacterium]|nr:23S rRNA pseudouridine(955/2504/2580) synthase RluC [Ectothiorhodospiraceae bacterium]